MKGTTVQLVVKTKTGVDPLGEPIYEEALEDIQDVLVGSPSADDITSTMELYGKHISYMLGIPKGDEHDWMDAEVIIWGERYHTIGYPITGEQENIPLRWGKNIRVERYGEGGVQA